MQLVKCKTKDLDDVADLYLKVVAHLKANVNYPKWSDDYPSRQSVAQCIESGEQYACVQDGALVGAVVLNENPAGAYQKGEWRKNLAEGEYLVLHTLAVLPALTGKGLGGLIVDECVKLAKNLGYKAIRLDVVPDNYPAIKLYEGKGFTFAGEKDLQRGIPYIPSFCLYELNF